jgi:surface antigen
MKTNFLLALLVLNGLLFGAKSAAAFTEPSSQTSQQIVNLSQSISKSIDLNENDRNLLESAIHRALLAKEEGSKTQPSAEPNVAGGMVIQGSEPSINGKVAQPQTQPSGKPIINGIILSQPDRPEQIRPRVRSERR